MIGIEMRFPCGRYHATPWDAHVNEGRVEWPPSPWRLLRALTAVWYLKAQDDIPRETLERLLTALASVPPSFTLPPAATGHTRHYMPTRGNPTKVFDAFVHVEADAPLVAWWPLALDEEHRAALSLLSDRLSYLGRAESLVEARVVEHVAPTINTQPLCETLTPGEVIRLLGPVLPQELEAWRTEEIASRQAATLASKQLAAQAKGKDPLKVKLSPVDRAKTEGLPRTVPEVLEAETSELRKQGWSRPPGTAWVDYSRPVDAFAVRPRIAQRRTGSLPRVARFAMASAVLPRLTEAVAVAERIHTVLVSRSDGATVFTGCDADSKPLQGHDHCYVMPEAHGHGGTISHITLYAPMGFDEHARRALEGLRGVWARGGHDLQLVLLGVGQPEDFAGVVPIDASNREGEACSLFGESQTWVSRTPFVATRFPKTNRKGVPKLDDGGLQVGSPEHDLRRLMRDAGLPEPVSVTPVAATELGGKAVRWPMFRRERVRGQGRRGPQSGYGFEVRFAEPVRGPIALGYGAHFGLGVFLPE